MRAIVSALVVSLLVILVSAQPAHTTRAQATNGTVTRSEYRAVQKGMTRSRVERIFKATPVCKTFDWVYDDGLRTVGFQYRKRGGRYVSVEFNNFERGSGRVRVDSKEFGHERYRCSTGPEHFRNARG